MPLACGTDRHDSVGANGSGVKKRIATARPGIMRLPRAVWALGTVSLLMDMSSEMIHALLPTFLVVGLGASAATLGAIEGIADGTASVAKLFSGWLSDRLGKRKALAVLGYGLAALSKPLFALAPNPAWVLIARFSDRVGKGIRGAPRDALIADLAARALHGAAYGLRQALDSVGAVLGPLAAVGLMLLFLDDIRAVFWVAVIPAVISVLALLLAVREPPGISPDPSARIPLRRRDIAALGKSFWQVVGVAGILLLARFSEAFLLLRAEETGLQAAYLPFLFVLMNSVFALTAYPMGALSDRIGRRRLVLAGFTVLAGADLVLAYASGLVAILIGAGLWGLHLAMTQGLLVALVADAADPARRGTAFGVFHLVAGVALLGASVIAGILWSSFGARWTFLAGAGLTAGGLMAALALLRHGANMARGSGLTR